MNNAAPRRLYEDDLPKQLAPVIPIKPVKRQRQQKVLKTVSVKTGNVDSTPVPAFTAPVFKPKKHDML